MEGHAWKMRSAHVSDLRPEARRRDRVAYETQPAASRQMRRDDGKPVGIMEGQMGDADAPSVDRQRLSDLTRVGDDSVTRQPHIFLTASRSGRGQKQLHGRVDGWERRIALARNPFDGARAIWRRAYGRLVVHGVSECLGGAAWPQNEFRLIRFDEARHQAFR